MSIYVAKCCDCDLSMIGRFDITQRVAAIHERDMAPHTVQVCYLPPGFVPQPVPREVWTDPDLLGVAVRVNNALLPQPRQP